MAETPQQPDDERDEAAEQPSGEPEAPATPPEAQGGEPEAPTAPPAGVSAESGTDEHEPEPEPDPTQAQGAPDPDSAATDEAPVSAPDDPAAAEGATPGAEEAALEDEGAGVEEPGPRVRPEIPGADLEPDIVVEGDDALTHGEAAAEGLVLEGEVEGVIERDSDDDGAPQAMPQAAIDLAAGARYRATGKRKTSIARVILRPGTGAYTVNRKTLEVFFPRPTLQRTIRQPLETVGYESRMDVVATIQGGGVSGQAGALRHGIARALIEADPNLRSELKRRGFLTRDARVKERKKAGLKKARKRPQFSKR